jgi:hypothetical protein
LETVDKTDTKNIESTQTIIEEEKVKKVGEFSDNRVVEQ